MASQQTSTWKDFILGNYDYGWLCLPVWPFGSQRKGRPPSPFFAVDSKPGIVVAMIMGLQHCLAMVGGIITPPLLVYRVTVPPEEFDTDVEQYLIASTLIISGISTFVQVLRVGIPTPGFNGGKVFVGTGLIAAMGTSFTFLPIAQSSLFTMLEEGDSWRVAYGRVLGTVAVASLTEIILALLPPNFLKKTFPPIVSGTAVFLIGASLVGTGAKYATLIEHWGVTYGLALLHPIVTTKMLCRYWGGGVFCADNFKGLAPEALPECVVRDADTGDLVTGTCFAPQIVPDCNTNGDVQLPFGSTEYMGLGLLVFVTLVVVELFGSPAMRNVQVIIGLFVGYLVAAVTTVDGKRYVTSDKIDDAPWFTFIWVETFPLGFYAPSILPLVIGFVISTVESIGDVSATAELSQLDVDSDEQKTRVQGGLLCDGLSSLFAALATSLPNTTYSENNGVVALTRCASRWAGIACAGWLFVLGVFAKSAAFITTIPDCVLGGMTTFLFANVMVSGIRMITVNGVTRRDRFILAISLSLGLGVIIVPQWTQNNLWPLTDDMSSGLRGLRDAVIITLSTGYSIGVVAAIILNSLLPYDKDDSGSDEILAKQLDASLDTSDYSAHTSNHPSKLDDKQTPLMAFAAQNDSSHGTAVPSHGTSV